MSIPVVESGGLPVPRLTPANRPYFEAAERGELVFRACPSCGTRFRPLSEWCPGCWSMEMHWQQASGMATVTHVTVVHQPPDEAFETPYALALVDLDEGVRVMTNVVGCDPDAVRIGMRVEVTFVARGNVHLPMFRPLGKGSE